MSNPLTLNRSARSGQILPGGKPAARPAGKPEKQVSTTVDALNMVLVEAGAPAACRAFIDGVVGAAGGSGEEFDLADRELAARVHPQRYGDKPDAGKKWAGRAREEYQRWQSGPVAVLIECRKGYRYEKEGIWHRQKSRYTTCLPAVVAEVTRAAEASALWATGRLEDREEALRKAAAAELARLPKNSGQMKEKVELGLDDRVARNLKTCVTKLERTIAELLNANRAEEAMRYQGALDHLRLVVEGGQGGEDLPPVPLSSSIMKKDPQKGGGGGGESEDSPGGVGRALARNVPVQTEDKSVPVDRPIDVACLARMAEVYPLLDVAAVHRKFILYCDLNGKQATQSYFFNFLRRERPEPGLPTSSPPAATAYPGASDRSIPSCQPEPATGEEAGASSLLDLIGQPNWRPRCYAMLSKMKGATRDTEMQGRLDCLVGVVWTISPEEFRERVEGFYT